MIDIHSHILCGVDDGPKTIEETKALLEHAYCLRTRSSNNRINFSLTKTNV